MNDTDILRQAPNAPQWGMFAGSAGSFLVWAGILFFVATIVLWILQPKWPQMARLATISFFAGTLSILGTMASLLALFIGNQFEYRFVFQHADNTTGLYYKIGGVWSGQEGSFLLWATTSAIFAMLAFRGTSIYRRWYCVAFSVFLGSLCGILAKETPFDLITAFAIDGVQKLPHTGQGLTPALQNYWVTIHPPTLFMGTGSLTVLFAMSISAMLTGNVTEWVKIVRPWALVSASILGLGIAMGGLWAYETQGWGGFWAWDPVENVSFVPWLFTVGLIHGIIVQVTKKRWVGSNLILGGLPFLTFVYGTLLTRSGLLTDVSLHSFAEMDRGALSVLISLLVFITLGFVVTYAMRGAKLAKLPEPQPETPGVDREVTYRMGVLLLSLMAIGITIGMSWPWWSILAATRKGAKAQAITEPQYHMVVVWFFIPIMLLMAIAPFVSWRPMSWKVLGDRLITILSVTAGLTGFALILINNPTYGVHLAPGETVWMPLHMRMMLLPWMAILIFVCTFVVVANLWRIAEIVKRARLTLGGFVAHIGVALLMTGLIISRGFEQIGEGNVDPALGATNILGYSVSFNKATMKSLNDRDGKVIFDVKSPTGETFQANPGLYFFQEGDEQKPMVWPFIQKNLSHDFYMAMSPPVLEATDVTNFKPGETKTFPIGDEDRPMDVMKITYKKFVRKGEVGTVGTTFGAVVHVEDRMGSYDIVPTLQMTDEGFVKQRPPFGSLFAMQLAGMDAADNSANLQVMFSPPLYPIKIFYKPMTILVWFGTGILFIGGLMSAFARRVRRTAPVTEPDPDAGLPEPPPVVPEGGAVAKA